MAVEGTSIALQAPLPSLDSLGAAVLCTLHAPLARPEQWCHARMPLAFLCCSWSLQGSLAGLSSQSPVPSAAPLPSAVTCTRAAVWSQTG